MELQKQEQVENQLVLNNPPLGILQRIAGVLWKNPKDTFDNSKYSVNPPATIFVRIKNKSNLKKCWTQFFSHCIIKA